MALNKTRLREIARSLMVTDQGDYRDYLSLVYAACKAEDASYSYIRFSEDLGLSSTNAHSVIAGRRSLTVKAAEKISVALGLTGIQRRYFLKLVEQKRARSTADRDEIFAARLELRQKTLPTELDKRQLAFFEQWYNAAILEILRLDDAQDQAEWLASVLSPSVPQAKVAASLQLLKDLGYIAFDSARNRYYPTDVTITTGNEIIGMAIASYHRQMLKLAVDSLDEVDADHRDISAVTLMASPALVAQFKDELAALRKKLLALAAQEQAATEVMQLNMQLFPLNTRRGTKP
ncbi:MAG: TIGR02147 family protein [Deltaproteobacteria bacterium]|nr:TIGR02147 family protein [Deltaproteobacteria bacterium]